NLFYTSCQGIAIPSPPWYTMLHSRLTACVLLCRRHIPMDAKKLLMIVNPTAGRNKPRGPLFDAAAELCDAGYLLSIHTTTSPDDAAQTAAARGGDYDAVVAVGGDGTLNQVVSGLMTLERRPLLGYIPQGSTNDFAASLHLPLDPVAAVEQIVQDPPRQQLD